MSSIEEETKNNWYGVGRVSDICEKLKTKYNYKNYSISILSSTFKLS